MKPWLKAVLYLVLTSCALWTAGGFYKNYKASNEAAAAPRVEGDAENGTAPKRFNSGAQGRMMGYAFGFIGAVIGLAFLVSMEASRWFANRTTDFLYNDNLEGVHNPDYDHAEQVALDGKHLEAIGLMREFLKKNPGEIYAAIRIAEIYEHDLDNQLAAALEYEEVLKHRFNPDRWGWTAIRLANLYSGKLNQTEKAVEWLKRISTQHPESAPAKKARERLGPSALDSDVPPPPTPPPPPEPPSTGGLPPGFSPKKR